MKESFSATGLRGDGAISFPYPEDVVDFFINFWYLLSSVFGVNVCVTAATFFLIVISVLPYPVEVAFFRSWPPTAYFDKSGLNVAPSISSSSRVGSCFFAFFRKR